LWSSRVPSWWKVGRGSRVAECSQLERECQGGVMCPHEVDSAGSQVAKVIRVLASSTGGAGAPGSGRIEVAVEKDAAWAGAG
jgi:hypothetical protein